MKKNKIFGIFVATLLIGITAGCSNNDDDNIIENVVNVQELTTITTNGTWRITSYVEDGDNETHHFTNYTLNFQQNGNVTAVNDNITINGTWAITDDDDDDSSSSNSDKDFVLNFNVGEDSDFDDLNDDWDIQSYSTNKISLVDVSGGDGGTDTLVLEKS